ncbi:MAG: hypothetical protein R3C49_26600 [Planctomycetaceae bacterium]
MAAQPASACCLFPFLPTYSMGYSPWGWGGGCCGYAPSYAGYAPAYSSGGCCNGGCSTGTYSAGYLGYTSNSYGIDCCGGCSSGCGSSCGSSCIGTETRKVPEPDVNYNGGSSSGSTRDFGGSSGSGVRSLEDEKPLDGFGRSRTNEQPGSTNGWNPKDRSLLEDGNRPSSGSGSGFGGDDLGRPPAFENRLNSPNSGTGAGGFKPLIDDTTGEHSARKPVIDTPIETTGAGAEAAVGADQPAPAPNNEATPAAEAEPPASDVPGTKTDAKDFLPAEETQARSSHFDVLRMPRLAGRSNPRSYAATQISSSRTQNHRMQWISVPLPAGRERL